MSESLIYVAEDDDNIREILRCTLDSYGYATRVFDSAPQLLEAVREQLPDLILMDIMMPGMDGLQALRLLKQERRTAGVPVIFLTAKSSEIDKVKGLDLGAEDYITKPFNMQILLRRVEVALRHLKKTEKPGEIWSDGYLTLNFSALTASRGRETLSITPNEYKLLRVLTENAGQVLTRQLLLDRLWDSAGNFIDDHTLTVTVNRLRGKIEDESHSYIRTVRGMGYIWTGGRR